MVDLTEKRKFFLNMQAKIFFQERKCIDLRAFLAPCQGQINQAAQQDCKRQHRVFLSGWLTLTFCTWFDGLTSSGRSDKFNEDLRNCYCLFPISEDVKKKKKRKKKERLFVENTKKYISITQRGL